MYDNEDEFSYSGRTIEDYLKIEEPGKETKTNETVAMKRLLRDPIRSDRQIGLICQVNHSVKHRKIANGVHCTMQPSIAIRS